MVNAQEGQAEHEVFPLATVALHTAIEKLERVLRIAKVDSYLVQDELE